MDTDLSMKIPGWKSRSGKVRDIYERDNKLVLVTTDRISAFDQVIPSAVPDKGRVLSLLSANWFDRLAQPHHMISTRLQAMKLPRASKFNILRGRCMLVKKTDVIPIECVVRGYLSGSGWKEYRRSGTVCGLRLPEGLEESSQLPEPIFTPATKEESGHDVNIAFEQMCTRIGYETARELRRRSLAIYREGAAHALTKGIIIADTKLEFGTDDNGNILLIDEVLTPDSSRFWPADQYQPGGSQPSFDKQFVRDWLENSGWDKESPPPKLPDEVISKTRAKYIEVYELLTGLQFPWK